MIYNVRVTMDTIAKVYSITIPQKSFQIVRESVCSGSIFQYAGDDTLWRAGDSHPAQPNYTYVRPSEPGSWEWGRVVTVVWNSLDFNLACEKARNLFRLELTQAGFVVTNDANLETRFSKEPGVFIPSPGDESNLGWLMRQPGWINGSGEYRTQAWLPMPDGRVLRVMSGEEDDEPDLLTDIYDPRGGPWDTKYFKPR